MARDTFKVEGLKELEEELLNFSRAVSGNILKRAVGTAGAFIAEKAQAIAPEDHGDLKREIKVAKPKIIGAGKAAYAKAMRETGDKAIAAAAARAANKEAGGKGRSAITHVGPTKKAPHGWWQEYGTVHHKPKPFMRPTWDAHGKEAAKIIRGALVEEIDKAKQRAAKRAARLAAKIAAGK